MTQSKSLDMKHGLLRNNQSKLYNNNHVQKTIYNIKKEPIGKGSFATVYYATGPDMQPYAIKRINVSKLQTNRLNKFLLELDISSQMEHENIVKCHEIFKTEKYWNIVSEYCNHGTFADLIQAIQKIDQTDEKLYYKQKEKLGQYYLTQLKNALKYIHENNIIHRDLKPMNILLTRTNDTNDEIVVKLADFGFARFFEPTIGNNTSGFDDMISTICGSPIYMAPELLIDNKYNLKADLWSFGVIMYEFLYGTNPYNFPQNIAHLKTLIETQKIKYDECYSNVAIDLMKKLLQTDPKNRITWEEFFAHEWFNIPNNQSNEQLDEQCEIGPPMTPIPDLSKLPSNIPFFDYLENNLAQTETMIQTAAIIHSPTMGKRIKSVKSELDMDEFVVVDPDSGTESIGIDHPQIRTYNETYASSVIKIFTDTIYMLVGQPKSY